MERWCLSVDLVCSSGRQTLLPLVRWRPWSSRKACGERQVQTASSEGPGQLSETYIHSHSLAIEWTFRGIETKRTLQGLTGALICDYSLYAHSLDKSWLLILPPRHLIFFVTVGYFAGKDLSHLWLLWGQGLSEEHWFVLARYNLLRWDFPGFHKSLFCIYHSTLCMSPSVPVYHPETLWSVWNISFSAPFPIALGCPPPCCSSSRICSTSFTLATDLDMIPG